MLLPIHIAAGGLAIVLGAVALSVKKGGTIHNGVRSQQMHVHFRTPAHARRLARMVSASTFVCAS